MQNEDKIRKNYIKEIFLIIGFIITTIVLFLLSLKNINIYNNESNTSDDIALSILLVIDFIITGAFVINYLKRIELISNKKLKILMIVTPICGIGFSCLFVNGIMDANFWWIKFVGIIFEFIIIGLYNLYLFNYCENSKGIYIILFLYNVFSIILSLKGAGLSYVHHYYLGSLLLFIPLRILLSKK